GYIAPDPLDENVYYAGSYGGLLTRFDRRTGQQRNINIWPDNPMGYGSEGITERFQWTFPIIFSPVDKKTIYASSQSIWKTSNAGQTWTKISPDLSRHDPKTMGPSGGPITKDNTGVETYGVVFAIAPAPQDINTIWAGSDDGLVHVTRNGGQNWDNVTPKDLPEFARISLIEASPHSIGTAYVAANRYQMDDLKPYVYKTTDYGKTWTKIVNGVKDVDFARQLREDPKRKGLLYLGTENGVYVSFDDGANWQSLQLNLPVTSVQGIQVADRDLVVATHGRSFWILDNIAVLRQATPAITTENLHLFDPIDPQRGLDRNVAIDYYLKTDADTVKIEILDAQGTVVREFMGDATPPPAATDGDGFFGGPPARVGIKKGMNRFTWDMRFAGATVFPGMIMWAANPARGPLAPPSDFTVRITAGGETKSQGFTIGIDKRLDGHVSAADLAEQFKLSAEIRDKVTEANAAVVQIRSIRDQVTKALEKVPQKKKAEIQAIADSVLKPIAMVEEGVYNTKLRSGQDPLNFPIRLNNKIAALQGVVESSDNKPTDQTYTVFKELSAKLDAEMQKLQQSLKADLPRLNAALRREKAGQVDPNAKPAPPAPPAAVKPPPQSLLEVKRH
ncbi:MAG: glycosyl hydrolase, partial [Vicinamibacterales bacterium]